MSGPCKGKGLGDRVEQALTLIGITSERVEQWLKRPCGCQERKLRLNQLGSWAVRVIQGNLNKAEEYLNRIIEQ